MPIVLASITQINATEISRSQDNKTVLLHFTDQAGNDLCPGDQYHDVATWDSTPATVIAGMYQQIQNRVTIPGPVFGAPKSATPVVQTAAQINATIAAQAAAAPAATKAQAQAQTSDVQITNQGAQTLP